MDQNRAKSIVSTLFGVNDESMRETAKEHVRQTLPTLYAGCYLDAITKALDEAGLVKRQRIDELIAETKIEAMNLMKESIKSKNDELLKIRPAMYEQQIELNNMVMDEYERAINDLKVGDKK